MKYTKITLVWWAKQYLKKVIVANSMLWNRPSWAFESSYALIRQRGGDTWRSVGGYYTVQQATRYLQKYVEYDIFCFKWRFHSTIIHWVRGSVCCGLVAMDPDPAHSTDKFLPHESLPSGFFENDYRPFKFISYCIYSYQHLIQYLVTVTVIRYLPVSVIFRFPFLCELRHFLNGRIRIRSNLSGSASPQPCIR